MWKCDATVPRLTYAKKIVRTFSLKSTDYLIKKYAPFAQKVRTIFAQSKNCA